jgi:hypothetical protein
MVRRLLAQVLDRRSGHEVHFHQGPHGPAPCFEGACSSPRLRVEEDT